MSQRIAYSFKLHDFKNLKEMCHDFDEYMYSSKHYSLPHQMKNSRN